MAEIWKGIKNFSGYEVSNLGRVRSCKPHWRKSHIVVGSVGSGGYHRITLSKENKAYCFLIHRLVLEAFVGPCPPGYEANHKDGIKLGNEPGNLEWTTRSKNMLHAYHLGLKTQKGLMNPKVRLKEKDVIEIREMAKQGIKKAVISKVFKITSGHLSLIIQHKLWNHI